MGKVNENVIEWITGSEDVTITASERALITKVKSICDKYPQEVKYYHLNNDGSILVKISKYCLSINAKKKVDMSNERKEEIKKRLSSSRKAKTGEKDEDSTDEEAEE